MPGTAHTWVDGDVATAAFLNALPRGDMGHGVSTTTQTGIGAAFVDITGLSVAFTAISSRIYRTTLYIPRVTQQSVTGQVQLAIRDSGGTSKCIAVRDMSASSSDILAVVLVETGLSGLITRKASITTSAGTVDVVLTANVIGSIVVEDVGV